MDVAQAREQLRRRYLVPRDAETRLDCEGDAAGGSSTTVEKKEKPLPRLNIHSGFWILASIVVTYYVDFFKTLKENFHTSSGLRCSNAEIVEWKTSLHPSLVDVLETDVYTISEAVKTPADWLSVGSPCLIFLLQLVSLWWDLVACQLVNCILLHSLPGVVPWN